MIRSDLSDYRVGIDATQKFIERARVKGIKILYGASEYFLHNTDLWSRWLARLGVTTHAITMNAHDVGPDDMCLIVAHLFKECASRDYIAIQTENLTTIYAHPGTYGNIDLTNSLKIMRGAVAVWDYSTSNVHCLKAHDDIHHAVPVPVMFSDNTKLFPTMVENNDFADRRCDVITSINTPRRRNLLRSLKQLRLSSVNMWRTKLPLKVHQCRIFLNSHAFGETSALEIHRLIDLRNVPIVIISEKSEDNEYQETLKEIPFMKFEELAPYCHKVAKDRTLWERLLREQLEMWHRIPDDRVYGALDQVLESVPVPTPLPENRA